MKPWLASASAVAAGFIVTALASTAADAVMHAADIFPSALRLMSDPLFALAAAYRALFTVAGGYVTARLAPWYAISIPVEAIPCVWLGGRLAASRRSSARASEMSQLAQEELCR